MSLRFSLLPYQAEFIRDTTTPELALVGGRGSGKSEVCPPKALSLAAMNVGFDGALLSPTGPMAAKVLIPRVEKYLIQQQQAGALSYQFNKTERRFDIKFAWTRQNTKLYVLSAENVRDSLGLNLAWFGIDEADTMAPAVAFDVWRKLNLAKRVGNVRQSFAVSTPEGFGFMYRNWDRDITDETRHLRRLIRARTADNTFLPPDFIAQIRDTYPAHMVDAYLNGEFVNMSSGSVYPDYDPELNGSNLTYAHVQELGDHIPLHIGMDFNVVNEAKHPHGIAVVVGVILNGQLHVIDEIYGHSRTFDAIQAIKARYTGRAIYVYPDASAKGDRTSAAVSDRTQLQAAGFVDRSPLGNPRIEDRVNAVSSQILNIAGDRRLRVNAQTCPVLVSCLAQQAYDPKTGEPQKDTGYDDPLDALGYMINVNWPMKNSPMHQGGILY